MRILVVVHDFLPETLAGTEVLAQSTINSLVKEKIANQKVEVGLFTSYYNLPKKSEIPVNIPPEHIYLVKKKKSAALFGSWSPIVRHQFKVALKSFKPDTVYFFHTLFLSIDLPLIAKKSGARVVYYLHDFSLICPRGTLLARNGTRSNKIDRRGRCVDCIRLDQHRFAQRWPILKPLIGPTMVRLLLKIRDRQTKQIFRQTDAFISPSETVAQALINFGLSANKMHIVPYGMPQLRPSSKKPTAKFQVGFVGTLAKHKGLPVLLKAASYLDPSKYQVNLFGQLKDQELIEQIKQLSNVTYHGEFLPQKVQFIYNKIDCLVAPSIWFENQPLVILQAFQTRTPVITSDLGGMRELVDDGKMGLLFPVGNAQALAETIIKLKRSPKLQKSIAHNQAKSPLPLSEKEHLQRVIPLVIQ